MSVELFIALCALIFTFYQAWLSRQHNRLSTQPHLQRSNVRDWTNTGLTYRLLLQNYGLGPARIKNVELFLNGKPFDHDGNDPIRTMIETAFKGTVPVVVKSSSFPAKNYVIRAQGDYTLVVLDFPGMKPENQKRLDASDIPRLDAKITYESFYRDEYVLDTRT